MTAGDRVYIKPLGTYGTVVRTRPDGRITAIGDGAAQAAVWLPAELEPAPDTDAIADDIAGELVTICATRADLDAAERIITRTSYL